MPRRSGRQVVVVTGASSGIGRATAHAFARRGARLVLAARGAQSLQAAAAECRALGAEAIAVPTDVADEEQVQALVATAWGQVGPIDVFVGNAGLFANGAFEEVPAEAFDRIMRTNVWGHVHAVRALLPRWRERGHGTYVMVASLQSLLSAPYQSAYVTSKRAALGLLDTLADESAGTGIRFAGVLPSTIDTPIYHNGANHTGRTSHPMPPTVSVERAARAVVRAAAHPRRRVYVGRVQAALVPTAFLAPALVHRITRPVVRTFALRGRGAPTDGNLYTSAERGNAVDGGWVARRRRVTRPLLLLGVGAALAALLARTRR